MSSSAGRAVQFGDLSRILPVLAGPGPIGIALLDGDLRFLAVNEAAAVSNGASIEEHLGRPAHEVAPEVLEAAGPLMRRVMETGEPLLEHPLSIEFPAGSGVFRHIVDNFYPLLDDRGTTVGVGSVWWEVTERTFAEKVLRETESRFRRTADPPPVLIWISGTDAKRTWFNQAWLDWTGRALAQQLGDGWAGAVHRDDLDHCQAIQQAAFERREPFEMEYRLRRAGGTYGWVLDRGVPRSDASGAFAGYIGSCADITELKRLQAVRRDTHERMSRLQSITAALSGASTQETVSEVVLSRVVPEIGADSAVTAILSRDGAHLEVVGSMGYRSVVVEHLRRRFPVDAPLPLAQAARTRQRVHYDSREGMLRDNPGMEGLVQCLLDHAVTALPLLWEDQLLGVLGVSWSPARTLDPQDLVFLDAVAGQLAQALERARLYEAEGAARREAESAARRLAFLAEASRILNASLDLNQTLARLARIAVPRLADWCAVYLLDPQGRPVTVATAHADPERVAVARAMNERWPLRMDLPGGTAEVLRTGESRLYPQIPDELLEGLAQDPEHLAILREVGLSSSMSVALRHGQRVVGAVTLANEAPRTADEADLALAEEFAARAATAVANAQAFAERARVARKLQASLLPASLPDLPRAQLAAGYLAAGEGEVGGDFYDAFPAGPGRWFLAIGDVRGKGVEAAAVTGLARHTIRSVALHRRAPSEILEDLNTVLLSSAEEAPDEPFSIPRFCTVCLVALQRSDSGYAAVVCSGGHPLPFAIRATGEVEEIGKPGSLLGVLPAPELHEVEVLLGPGDTLLCITDGITERRHEGRFFEDHLADTLASVAGRGARAVADAVQLAARDFVEAVPLDDMAILTLYVSG